MAIGSYNGEPWVHNYGSGYGYMFPLFDGIGAARYLVNAPGAITDTYELDPFGRSASSSGSTPILSRVDRAGALGYHFQPRDPLKATEAANTRRRTWMQVTGRVSANAPR